VVEQRVARSAAARFESEPLPGRLATAKLNSMTRRTMLPWPLSRRSTHQPPS
jgi:hypothetical protein